MLLGGLYTKLDQKTTEIPNVNNEPRTLVWQVVVTMSDVGL